MRSQITPGAVSTRSGGGALRGVKARTVEIAVSMAAC
jgi:hypothetical protein